MIKAILLVTCLLGQTLAAPTFEIDWLLARMSSDGQNNIYELSENETSSSNSPEGDDTNTIFSIDESDQTVDAPRSTEQKTTTIATPTTEATTTRTTKQKTTTTATTTTEATTTTKAPILELDIEYDTIYKYRNQMREFAAQFYKQVLKESRANVNILYSPISIIHAMGMLNTGARGITSNQIKESLFFDANTPSSYIDTLIRLTTSSKFEKSTNSDVIKRMVARTYIGDRSSIEPSFIEAMQTKYNSDIENINFANSESARNHINQWVEEETKQLIKDLVPQGAITPDTSLILVNAIYFKAPWSSKFTTTSSSDFKTPTGTVTVPFMSERVRCRVKDTFSLQYIAIPYQDGKTYFFIILPKANYVMERLEDEYLVEHFKRLDYAMFNEWNERVLELHMPKFSVEQDIDVETILESMGVTDLFDQGSANLTGISKGLHVSDFVHKAKLSIDEKGTEAAAASAVVIAGRALVEEVHVNRPFLFGIIEREGDLLFMGKIVNPSGR